MPSTLDEYEVLCTIGSGSYGTCKKIRRKKDGKILVWKELDYGSMSESEKAMLVSEVNLLRELKHQHIVRYYDRIIDRANTSLYIIMEYCEGGDLATLINKMKREGRHVEEDFIWRMCYQMTLALKKCHSRQNNGKSVLHRDLKPANVFLDCNNCVKIGDFGLARVLNHETSFARTFVGTPYYMSPEQMNCSSYNEKSDIWSMGCLLYELCSLRPPFTASNQKELASKICCGRFSRIPMRYSDELNEVIGYMLIVDEKKRHTIDSLLTNPHIMSHMKADLLTLADTSDDEASASSKLKQREEALAAREKLLIQKEKGLEAKEKDLLLKEKVSEERLARAERLMRQYRARVKSGELLNKKERSSGCKETPSILCKEKKAEENGIKHVSFSSIDKENTGRSQENGKKTEKMTMPKKTDYERRLELQQEVRLQALRSRLNKNKILSNELRNVDELSQYKARRLLAIR